MTVYAQVILSTMLAVQIHCGFMVRLPHTRIVQKNMNDHSMEVFWGKRCTILHVILAQRRPKNKLQTSCQTFDYSR